MTPGEPEVTVSADGADDVTTEAPAETGAEPAPVAPTEPVASAVPAEPVAPVEADEALLAAHELAYAALLEITPAATIGKPAGHIVEPDGVVSLMFETTLLGYPGWFWTVSLARVAGEEPTVLEAELLPGEKALVAPEWVPWAVRLADYQAAQTAAAELAADDDDAADDDIDDDDLDDDDDDELDFDPDDMRSEGGDDLNGVDIDALGDADIDDNEDVSEADDDAQDESDESDDDDTDTDGDSDDEDSADNEPTAIAQPEKKRRRLSWRRLRR